MTKIFIIVGMLYDVVFGCAIRTPLLFFFLVYPSEKRISMQQAAITDASVPLNSDCETCVTRR